MDAGGSVEVTVPIKPLVELGPVEITLKCITQFGLDVETATIQVQVGMCHVIHAHGGVLGCCEKFVSSAGNDRSGKCNCK